MGLGQMPKSQAVVVARSYIWPRKRGPVRVPCLGRKRKEQVEHLVGMRFKLKGR